MDPDPNVEDVKHRRTWFLFLSPPLNEEEAALNDESTFFVVAEIIVQRRTIFRFHVDVLLWVVPEFFEKPLSVAVFVLASMTGEVHGSVDVIALALQVLVNSKFLFVEERNLVILGSLQPEPID